MKPVRVSVASRDAVYKAQQREVDRKQAIKELQERKDGKR